MKKYRKKSNKGKIIWDHDEFIEYYWKNPAPHVFADIPNHKSKPKGRGIYALYDNFGLYYVGLTNRSLRGRIRRHTTDKHRKKWNRFSWYQIPNLKYTKDMETALLRIVNPKGNKIKGKIKKKSKKKDKFMRN